MADSQMDEGEMQMLQQDMIRKVKRRLEEHPSEAENIELSSLGLLAGFSSSPKLILLFIFLSLFILGTSLSPKIFVSPPGMLKDNFAEISK